MILLVVSSLAAIGTPPVTTLMGQPPADVAIMIHGAGGGGWEYDRWKPIFERAGWKVIAPDLMPAKGGLAATRFDDYIKQVVSWVPARHGKLVLVGASMGGLLALKAAEKKKVDAILLVNSAAPVGVGVRKKTKPHPPIVRWANGPIKDTRDALPDGDEATVQWAYPKWRDESGSVLNEIHTGVKVARPRVPVLAILGEADSDIPHETGLALAKWFGAVVQSYKGTSHVGPLYGRRAAEIAGAAVRWISTVK